VRQSGELATARRLPTEASGKPAANDWRRAEVTAEAEYVGRRIGGHLDESIPTNVARDATTTAVSKPSDGARHLPALTPRIARHMVGPWKAKCSKGIST
jgi:hypothetical protein